MSKETVAILFGVCVTIFTLYLIVTKQIDAKISAVLLIFALIGGLGIANYDIIKRIKWKDIELETYERKVQDIKEGALHEIEREVINHKESISLLIANLNDTREKIDAQRKAVKLLVEKISQQEQRLQYLANKADSTKNRIEILHKASSDLALLLTKITWLQVETKSEFGTNRAQKAIEQILNDLNRIVAVVIPDTQERSRWVGELQSSLPPR